MEKSELQNYPHARSCENLRMKKETRKRIKDIYGSPSLHSHSHTHTHTHTHTHIYIYIYIYISLKKKTKTGYFRIINLFPSCFFVSGVNQKHEEKYNRTSSDPMDK